MCVCVCVSVCVWTDFLCLSVCLSLSLSLSHTRSLSASLPLCISPSLCLSVSVSLFPTHLSTLPTPSEQMTALLKDPTLDLQLDPQHAHMLAAVARARRQHAKAIVDAVVLVLGQLFGDFSAVGRMGRGEGEKGGDDR